MKFMSSLFSEENQQLSFDSPRISDRKDKVGYSYESPPSSPGPIIIDKSIHLSPTLPSQAGMTTLSVS